MKHIKKKFQFEHIITQEVKDLLSSKAETLPYSQVQTANISKDRQALLITDSNKIFTVFRINLFGKNYFIPEPDPVLIYFHNAYVNYTNIQESKKNIIKALEQPTLSEQVINHLYNHFGLTNGFIIFLFTAIEAFINRNIPDRYSYSDKKNNRTEIYDKDQIQRHISFDDKLNKVLFDISKKSFKKAHPIIYQHILNLKEFRDLIIHTKSNPKDLSPAATQFDYLYKKALGFKYEETLYAVRSLMNYYEPNYIEECPCGNDW